MLVVGHPFDSVKVRLQGSTFDYRNLTYRNSVDCAIKMFQREGVGAFYRGVAAPMAGVGVANAALFGVYGALTSKISQYRQQGDRVDLAGHLQNTTNLSVIDNIFCATCGGVAYGVCMTPFDVIKIRLQTMDMFSHRNYFGAIHSAKSLYREGGIKKLYLGLAATIIRDIPGSVAYLGAYGYLRQMLPQSSDKLNVVPILFAGGCAGVAQWMIVFPLDTIKTRQQIAKTGMFIDWLHVARDLYRTEGVAAFYAGIAPALFRAFFANAACFVGVEMTVKMLALRNQSQGGN